jgi:hypothetical protein
VRDCRVLAPSTESSRSRDSRKWPTSLLASTRSQVARKHSLAGGSQALARSWLASTRSQLARKHSLAGGPQALARSGLASTRSQVARKHSLAGGSQALARRWLASTRSHLARKHSLATDQPHTKKILCAQDRKWRARPVRPVRGIRTGQREEGWVGWSCGWFLWEAEAGQRGLAARPVRPALRSDRALRPAGRERGAAAVDRSDSAAGAGGERSRGTRHKVNLGSTFGRAPR